MDRSAPRAGRLRSGRLVLLSLVVVFALGACGSSAAGAGGGGGAQGDANAIIAEAQARIGTSMVGGELQGDTITITMVSGFGAGGANLFMCSILRNARATYDPTSSLKIVMVDTDGVTLAKSEDCK